MRREQEPVRPVRYRVWIARCDPWEPADHGDIPPSAVAIGPAEAAVYSRRQAARYVRAFNRAALRRERGRIWAVAVPVTVVYQGDPRPGEVIAFDRGRE